MLFCVKASGNNRKQVYLLSYYTVDLVFSFYDTFTLLLHYISYGNTVVS